jgi:hypothetical protein
MPWEYPYTAGQVLEIPPAGASTTPSRESIFRNATGGNMPCDCGPQGQPYNPANQHQPPLSNQGLGQPISPQKPFEPLGTDPCQTAADQLAKYGIDPNCLMPSRRQTSPSRRRRAPRMETEASQAKSELAALRRYEKAMKRGRYRKRRGRKL